MMLLQTLVQLNILILAAPALAGWTLLPTAPPGLTRAACVAWHGRAARAAAPTSVRVVQASEAQATACPRPVAPPLLVVRPPLVAAAVASFNPFPHATRAP